MNGRVLVKIWAPLDQVESAAMDQLKKIASLPFVFKHVAAMPDVHLGKGATVGSVIATKGAVCPAAVGVDIGCGMAALKIADEGGPVKAARLSADGLRRRLRIAIEARVPVGFEANTKIEPAAANWAGWNAFGELHPGVHNLKGRAESQLGSLGGGNHFIEVCVDTNDEVWVMLHSGSRNIGKEIAEQHIATAKNIARLTKLALPDPDLAYFVETQSEYARYIHDLLWAQDYARQNREVMLKRVLRAIEETICPAGERLRVTTAVNCHHNFAVIERHFGEDVLVTRKGAVRARKGDMGIIPGSMGTKSFIVHGRGNPDSFSSCSHGAGRRMSRGQAKKTFTIQDLAEQTAGIECRKDAGVIDEIPQAYKNIDEVMANQSDLVEIVAELKQVLCVKG